MRYERLTYENNHGTKIEFGDGDGIYVNVSDIRDYDWQYTTTNNRIKRFYSKVTKFTLPVRVLAPDEETAIALKNKICEVADRDVIEKAYGKIWIGEYYMPCYISGSKKSNYSKCANYLETSLTVVSDYPRWTKETEYNLRNSDTDTADGYDYPYDYAHDYGKHISRYIVNDNYVSADFRLIIYGTASTCYVKIGDNIYSVDSSLKNNERLEIDTRDKTVYHYGATGEKTSLFSKRDREHYIFEKLPTGKSVVERDSFIDIIVYNERSEPIWT